MTFDKKPWLTEEYLHYIRSDKWKRLRLVFLSIANRTCAGCGSRRAELHVHHLHYKTLGRESFGDVKVLCEACHANEENEKDIDRHVRGVNAMFDNAVRTYAEKKYGEDYLDWPDDIEDEFKDWLENRKEGRRYASQ